MKRLIDYFPGLPMPVSEVSRMLAEMWDGVQADGTPPPSDFRASQMNLVLHFGLRTSEEEARRVFDTAIDFAQRYPCRIIVLAPREEAPDEQTEEPLSGKLFSQCYIGPSLRELCCCEALILNYPLRTAELIDHAVSLWLETDLPVYHWFHRMPADRIERYYKSVLYRSKRLLYDREVEGDALDGLDLPKKAQLADLAFARTLPLRQNLGQFLSNFRPAALIEGLRKVLVTSDSGHREEAGHLARWTQSALKACGEKVGQPEFAPEVFSQEGVDKGVIRMEWLYQSPDRFLRWEHDAEARSGFITCDFGMGRFEHPMHIESLPCAQCLAEALLF